jgi:tetratricopeptide (TPR) repeat protein
MNITYHTPRSEPTEPLSEEPEVEEASFTGNVRRVSPYTPLNPVGGATITGLGQKGAPLSTVFETDVEDAYQLLPEPETGVLNLSEQANEDFPDLPVNIRKPSSDLLSKFGISSKNIQTGIFSSPVWGMQESLEADKVPVSPSLRPRSAGADSHDEMSKENGSLEVDAIIERLSLSSDSSPSTMSIAIAESAVEEAIGLQKLGLSLGAIFQELAGNLVYGIMSDDCSAFCDTLEMLCYSYEQRNLLEMASMTHDLMQHGYTKMFGSSSKEAMRCIFREARILRKKGEYKLSESAYRKAIEGFRSLGETKHRLKSQLFLGDFLRSLDRDSEALELLIETLIEHLTSGIAAPETSHVIDSIQKLHLKIVPEKYTTSVTDGVGLLQQFLSLQQTLVHCSAPIEELNVWVHFTQLGSFYSKLGKFSIAELCFAFPQLGLLSDPRFDVELACYRKECCLHHRRKGNFMESLKNLELAFVALRILGAMDQHDYDLAKILEQVLTESKPQESQDSSQISSEMKAWMRAQEAYRELNLRCLVLQEISNHQKTIEHRLTQLRGSANSSSHGSSMISSGSTSSRFGVTYSVGSASSIVSNSVFMVP